jgi:hypothetical protein
VHHVRTESRKTQHAERVLERLERQAERRPPEEPRGAGVEQLPPPVAGRRRPLAEAEPRRDELDLGAGVGERGGELVVVERRERGRIGEHHAHCALH